MTTIGDVARITFAEMKDRAKRHSRSWKRFDDRAAIARCDEMTGIPAHIYSAVIPQIERVVTLCESPIEQVALYQMAGRGYGHDFKYPMYASICSAIPAYFDASDFVIVPQYPLGPYRVDFLVAFPSRRMIAVECDGKKYHDFARDDYRDRDLRNRFGVNDVVRARGAEIWRGPSWTDQLDSAIRRVEW